MTLHLSGSKLMYVCFPSAESSQFENGVMQRASILSGALFWSSIISCSSLRGNLSNMALSIPADMALVLLGFGCVIVTASGTPLNLKHGFIAAAQDENEFRGSCIENFRRAMSVVWFPVECSVLVLLISSEKAVGLRGILR